MRGRRVSTAAVGAALVLAALATDAWGGPAGGLLDLLRPGSRPSAMGAGADPFLSPLEDESGWWAEQGLSAPSGTKLEYRASDPLRGSMPGRLSESEISWRTSAEGRRLGLPWEVAARLRQPRDAMSFAGGSGWAALERRGGAADAAVRVAPRPWLMVQGEGPVWSQSSAARSRAGAGARWQAGQRLVLQSSWDRSRLPDDVSSVVLGNAIGASLNLGVDRFQMDGRWRPFGALAAELSATRMRAMEIDPRSAATTYQVLPRGSGTMEQASLSWGQPRRRRLLLRWTHSLGDLEADLSWSGQRFGQVSYARAGLHSYLAAYERYTARGSRRLFEVEQVRAEGRARGEAELWPFTATLVDLLGPRRIYKALGEADWSRWHVANEHGIGRAVRVSEGLEWVDALPRATLESWRPAVLVFGKADDQLDRLDVRRLQLAVLSLGFSARLGSQEVTAGLEQFVFARAFRERSEPVGESSSSEVAPSVGRSGNWPGITRLRLGISRGFGPPGDAETARR